jgi:hypothetical protein
MANTRNGNTWYVDATGTLGTEKNVLVPYIFLTATGANARIVLSDQATGSVKVDLRLPTAGDTQLFRVEANPILFPNAIEVTTLTNAVATVLVTRAGN